MCPGPGCTQVGSFSIPIPAGGKISFYVVTFKGKAAKAPVVSLTLTGTTPTGNVAIAAVEPKSTVKNGTVTVRILLGISNVKLRGLSSARGGTTSFGGFAPSGSFSPEGYPSVTPTPAAKFDGDYLALKQLGESWELFWLGKSPQRPNYDVARYILSSQIKASYK